MEEEVRGRAGRNRGHRARAKAELQTVFSALHQLPHLSLQEGFAKETELGEKFQPGQVSKVQDKFL